MDFIIMLAGIVQLNAMHIGNNKNFSFLLHNAKSTKVYKRKHLLSIYTNKIYNSATD